MCQNKQHRVTIDNLYQKIIDILQTASVECHCCHKCQSKSKPKNQIVYGWNNHVRDAHKQARLDYKMYLLNGKPSNGPILNKMLESRKFFKSRLKYCQNNQEQIRMDSLASKHRSHKFKKFWKDTKSLNGKTGLPVSVEGVSDPKCIANIFKDCFSLGSCSPPVLNADIPTIKKPIRFSASDVAAIIRNMKSGKSPGFDGLSIEHLRCAGVHLFRVLGLLFTMCLHHSYIPHDLMRTVVVPVVKRSVEDLSNKTNYRPISLATVIAKVFDGLLNKQLQMVVALQDTQFGFRAGLSTEDAILSLKHTVNYYVGRKTPIYACFLDLSRAFDLVSYDKLWTKLGDAGVSPDVVAIFSYWYNNQVNSVRWGSTHSDDYSLKCGVRQGGLTSPSLFNLYINKLIEELSGMHVGCHIDDVCLNNLSYADDMVLLSPSIGGLRKLLRVCESYVTEHSLRYNDKKSNFMLFKGNEKEPSFIPPVTLNGVTLSRVTSFRYLGHIVTEKLNDNLDIQRERRSLSVRGNMLAHRFAKCTAPVKIALFKSYCQSFYTSSLWASFTQRAYSDLRIQYNNVFRALFRLPRYCSASGMFADASVDDFYAIMRKRVASMVCRIRGSSNSVLKVVANRMDSALLGRFTRLHVVR